MSDLNGKACLDRGWPTFTIAHQLHIGYLLMFKKIITKEFKVIIFYKTGCEVVKHPENLRKRMSSKIVDYETVCMFIYLFKQTVITMFNNNLYDRRGL